MIQLLHRKHTAAAGVHDVLSRRGVEQNLQKLVAAQPLQLAADAAATGSNGSGGRSEDGHGLEGGELSLEELDVLVGLSVSGGGIHFLVPGEELLQAASLVAQPLPPLASESTAG